MRFLDVCCRHKWKNISVPRSIWKSRYVRMTDINSVKTGDLKLVWPI
jgi:hypothetical protein